jgi:hypothetical protein
MAGDADLPERKCPVNGENRGLRHLRLSRRQSELINTVCFPGFWHCYRKTLRTAVAMIAPRHRCHHHVLGSREERDKWPAGQNNVIPLVSA